MNRLEEPMLQMTGLSKIYRTEVVDVECLALRGIGSVDREVRD